MALAKRKLCPPCCSGRVPVGANNAFSAFAVPNGGDVPDCEKGCIGVFGRRSPGEDDD